MDAATLAARRGLTRALLRWCALLSLVVLVAGCYLLQSASRPIPAQAFPAPAGADGLVVMLPGFADGPRDFVEQGFVDAVRAANPGYDVLAVNAHWGYYRDYSVVERLREDVLEPARERYRRIWLVGISMGGFGAAAYAQTYPQHVDGLILLAPFMGSETVVEDVLATDRLADWRSPVLASIADRKERRFYELWQFYREYAVAPRREPLLYIGFGAEDHLRPPNQRVAEVLDDERSLMLPGGHKWTVWKPLFDELSKRALGRPPGTQ